MTLDAAAPRRKRLPPLPVQMLIALVLGVGFGAVFPDVGASLQIVGTIFIKLVKMIVVPLVFTAITLGIHHMGDNAKAFGRVSIVSLLYFFAATFVSILIGIGLNQIFRPGLGTHLDGAGGGKAVATAVDWSKFFLDIIPQNIVHAMAGENLLPVLVFAVIFGLALAAIGRKGEPVINCLEALMATVFKMTDWIISLSPIAIFAVISWLAATQGAVTILSLAKLVAVFYLGLAILLIIFALLMVAIGEKPIATAKAIAEPVILAFATRSSEATLPLHIEKLIQMGVPKAIASLVLPLGYAFNRDGSIMYFALAVGFLADAYGVHLGASQLLTIIVVTAIASKGSANIPSGGLVAVAMVLTTIGVPVEALAIIAGVDAFLDMGRTAVNVISNTVAVKLVMKLSGVEKEDADAGEPAATEAAPREAGA